MTFTDPTLTDRIRETMERHRRTLNRLHPERGCALCNTALIGTECPRCDSETAQRR